MLNINNLLVGTYQTNSIRNNIQESINILQSIVYESSLKSLDIILFPELFLSGYDIGVEQLKSLAINQNSNEIKYICNLAKEHHIAICLGYSELSDDGIIYNSAILINGLGEIVLNYRKTHLWDPTNTYEKVAFVPGDSLPVASLFIPRTNQNITVGILICFDVEFPEPSRVLTLAGASIILVPTAVVDTLPAECMVPTRAGENQVFIIYSNFSGPCLTASTPDTVFCGLSGIFGPDGRHLVRAKSDEIGLFTTELNGESYREYVFRNNYLVDRINKTHLYSSIITSNTNHL